MVVLMDKMMMVMMMMMVQSVESTTYVPNKS